MVRARGAPRASGTRTTRTTHVPGLRQLARAGQDAFHQGFTSAARGTLIMPLVVLAIGAIACLLMSGQAKPKPADAPPELVGETA